MDSFSTAFQLHTWGYSVIPSGGGESGKVPLVDWGQYQHEQPSDEQMEEWNTTYSPKLWGIVCNSTLAVIDADTTEARAELETEIGQPHVSTPRGGAHWYINTTGHALPTKAGILPGIDVRGEGGFVNIAGGEYQILRIPSLDSLIEVENVPARILEALDNHRPAAIEDGEPIPEGRRNAALASIAGALRKRGLNQAAIQAALLAVNTAQCQPPLPDNDVRKIATSYARYPVDGHSYDSVCMYNTNGTAKSTNERDKNGTDNGTPSYDSEAGEVSRFDGLAKRIETWVRDTRGWWETQELDRELGIEGPKQKESRKKALQRLREKGIVERHPKINKQFRYVNTRVTSLNFKTAASAGVLPVRWPLGIERKVNLFPGNIVVVAGSPNSGKTALLLSFIHLNQDRWPIYYFCSEMGEVELRDRLELFPGMAVEDWKFNAIERASDFPDVVVPDAVNIIDFLEMTTELYSVNTHLVGISQRLGSGLAIVALQKKVGATYGRGQEFGLEKPKLYLSMDSGKLRIVKGKSWATKGLNPNELTVKFEISDGCQFKAIGDWQRRDYAEG